MPEPAAPEGQTRMEQIGAAVAAIGSASCPARLAQLLRAVVPYSYTVIFGYCGTARPLDLWDDFPPEKRKVFVTDYQAGPYLLDPFYLAATSAAEPGLYRLRELAPDRFYQGEYFRNYYAQTGLAEEIAFFSDLGAGAVIVLSLMRADKPFTNRELRTLAGMRAVVNAVVGQHWRDIGKAFHPAQPRQGERGRDIEKSFHSFGAGLLTPREREVVEFTLKGHSAEAIGRMLGISPGTVRIHRRNIYGKLRISSQGELFSRFIATLEGLPAFDPT